MWEAIQKIIVATDFSELSEAAVRSAAVIALPDDASVHLLHVIRLPFADTNYRVHIPEAIQENIRKKTRKKMYESMLMLEEAGVSEVDLIVSESRQPSNAIAESVRELDAVGKYVKNANLSAKTHMRKGVAADVIAEEADRSNGLGSDRNGHPRLHGFRPCRARQRD